MKTERARDPTTHHRVGKRKKHEVKPFLRTNELGDERRRGGKGIGKSPYRSRKDFGVYRLDRSLPGEKGKLKKPTAHCH